MTRIGRFILAAVLCSCLIFSLAACTSNEVTPTPTPIVSPSPSPEVTPTLEPTGAEQFTPIGANIKLLFNGSEINAVPYYGPGNTLILPLHPLAEALGYKVDKATSGTRETLTITKEGAANVVLQYIPPSVGQSTATNATATKGGANIAVDGTLFYVDGTVYVPEAFIDEALMPIDVTVNESTVNVAPAA